MRIFVCWILIMSSLISFSQTTSWRGIIRRADGNEIAFNFKLIKHPHPTIIISNATEKINVKDIRFTKDSVFIKMPVFESAFKAKVTSSRWEGIWIKGTTSKEQELPFTAILSNKRFDPVNGNAKFNISGRWAIKFGSDESAKAASLGEFKQSGNIVTGTFLTPTGDYRYLEGVISGNKLLMSGFDGGHAFLFKAEIKDKSTLKDGVFYSGAIFSEPFSGKKDAKATVSTDEVSMFLKPGEKQLDFTFRNLDGKNISIKNDAYKNKVVVIQILGSWCPNCMDETSFLSDFYNTYKSKGVEVIGLAYEYSTDFNRSVASLMKFKNQFHVNYPLLITGTTVNDPLRTEKTLPQVTPIKVFPSTIFIDKKGEVRKFETGFFGPGTGDHFTLFKKEFYKTIETLLKE